MALTPTLNDLLRAVLVTHSPTGCEEEAFTLVEKELCGLASDTWRDESDNTIARWEGGKGPVTCVGAHVDEVALIVKRIEKDGKVRVESVGGVSPWKWGETPVEILGANSSLPGVLSVGSTHTTKESAGPEKARTSSLTWDALHVQTRLSHDELAEKGFGPGDRVVMHRAFKTPLFLEDSVAGWGLDDKAGVAILILLAHKLAELDQPLPGTVYLAFTSAEEFGTASGSFLGHTLNISQFLSVETAPVAEEYGIENCPKPVVWYEDSVATYDIKLSNRLVALAEKLGFGAQRAVFCSAGTDATAARKAGLVPRAACVGFPTENTHGYEVANLQAMSNIVDLVAAFVTGSEG